ncbi:hypothetical protein BAE30_00230 [Acidithiobacillus caldus]|uniref:Uncharacterized protein n=1 Tax=Acidithiobacillus caldus TaxID=33059 RepID=A0A1E7Z4I3_9PROT|nr:hypothetical protein BAE30_00230 [Acidithiobacillus caldus]
MFIIPPRNIFEEIGHQLPRAGESVNFFLAAQVPMVSFPSLVVVAQYALAENHISEPIFE